MFRPSWKEKNITQNSRKTKRNTKLLSMTISYKKIIEQMIKLLSIATSQIL